MSFTYGSDLPFRSAAGKSLALFTVTFKVATRCENDEDAGLGCCIAFVNEGDGTCSQGPKESSSSNSPNMLIAFTLQPMSDSGRSLSFRELS
eukprot:m.266616 g.266616  ORF g.266616 m.266616 type:complete len:92 (+) comp68417_c0_seq1:356-631(+)